MTGDKDLQLPRCLVLHGARLDLRNRRGLTAVDIAPDYLKEELNRLYKESSRKNTNAETSTSGTRPSAGPKKCITCQQRDADVIFLPCAHKLVCRQCTGSQKTCVECGKTVEGRIDTDGNHLETSNSSSSTEGARTSDNDQQPECKVQ